mgnify:CR=1 FL=1
MASEIDDEIASLSVYSRAQLRRAAGSITRETDADSADSQNKLLIIRPWWMREFVIANEIGGNNYNQFNNGDDDSEELASSISSSSSSSSEDESLGIWDL